MVKQRRERERERTGVKKSLLVADRDDEALSPSMMKQRRERERTGETGRARLKERDRESGGRRGRG